MEILPRKGGHPTTSCLPNRPNSCRSLNEEGCLLKRDPWPCLLDGPPSSEGVEHQRTRLKVASSIPVEVHLSSWLFFPTVD